jgi:hypothetical protein
MRKRWIVLTVCSGVAAGFAWGSSVPSEAAMVIGDSKVNMSLVQTVAKKRRAPKAKCEQKLIFWCCTVGSQPEQCTIK